MDGKKRKRKMKTDESVTVEEPVADIESKSNKKSKLFPVTDNIRDIQQTKESVGGESSLSVSGGDEIMTEKESPENQINNLRNSPVTGYNKDMLSVHSAHELHISYGGESFEMLKFTSVGDCNSIVVQKDNLHDMKTDCAINIKDSEFAMETDESDCETELPKCVVLGYGMNRSFEILESEKIEYVISDLEFKNLKHSTWDFTTLDFPDIGTGKIISLVSPSTLLLPPGIKICTKDLCFNAEKYRRNSIVNQKKQNKFDKETNIENLDFSYAEMLISQNKIQANNWTEYKEKLMSPDCDNFNKHISPVEHLWKDDVTPLVRPQDAINTGNGFCIWKRYFRFLSLDDILTTFNMFNSSGILMTKFELPSANLLLFIKFCLVVL